MRYNSNMEYITKWVGPGEPGYDPERFGPMKLLEIDGCTVWRQKVQIAATSNAHTDGTTTVASRRLNASGLSAQELKEQAERALPPNLRRR